MLNKILLRKIKFPLSLRGAKQAFPHVIARERSNLNNKGFSLIELMVAVAILALVSIGIFQAFSVAFQTLNDAKDRTVATNYAQQILEDYKNTHFEKIKPFSDSIEGTKFTQNVGVNPIDDNKNLIKVIVEISWSGRNNNPKNVNVSTLIYNTQTIAESGSTPSGIFIYANPYNLLPGTDERAVPSEIFAEIVDKNGNLITDWNESNVDFSIESVVNLENEPQDTYYLGNLSIPSDMPVKGVAETTFIQFTGEEREGYVKIKATLNVGGVGEIYDTLILKVTNEAVAIVLASDKEIISTEGGTAHLTATIVDAVGDLVVTDRAINFNIISGPGNLTNFVPTSDGVASIDLIPGSTSGITTINATSNLLEPDSINIEIVDPGATYITVKTNDQTIVQQGTAEITAYLTNYLRHPISGEIINFTTTMGSLSSASEVTGDNGGAVTTLTMNYAGTATVTASWTAEDGSVIFDTVKVLCKNHNLYVSVDPTTITEGSSTTISAELTNSDGFAVASETIYFAITGGNGNLSSDSGTTNDSGETSVTLTIYSVGTTTVEASWSGDLNVVTGNVEVICTSAPIYMIVLTGNTPISVGESSTITATVTEGGDLVGSGTAVTFSLNNYTNAKLNGLSSPVTAYTDINSVASVTLSGLTAGETVTITATVDTASNSISISCEAPSISIDLADPDNIKYMSGQKQVYFNIIINGGSINLNKMKIIWASSGNDDEKLETLLINDRIVYENTPGADNGTTITFNRDPFYYTLTNGQVYTIKMIFNNKVKDRDWTITFINPNTDEDIIPPVTFDKEDF